MSNLPPGCRDSDIPGNRPEELAWEAAWESFDAALYDIVKLPEHMEAILALAPAICQMVDVQRYAARQEMYDSIEDDTLYEQQQKGSWDR